MPQMPARSVASCRCSSSRSGDRSARIVSRLTILLLLAAFQAAGAVDRLPTPFGIDDYFRVARIGELALSPDGGYLVYTVDQSAPGDAAPAHKVELRALRPKSAAIASAKLDDARSFAWIPQSARLAFLSNRSGSAQVHSVDVTTGDTRQLTKAADPVTQFSSRPMAGASPMPRAPTETPLLPCTAGCTRRAPACASIRMK